MEYGWSELKKDTSKVRKWSEKDIMIKLTNLSNKLGWVNVHTEIEYYKKYTDNTCDAMNLAYYSLKDKFSKIERHRFGYVRSPEYEPKKRKVAYNGNYTLYYNDYTSLYTTSFTTSATSNAYYGSIW